MILMLLGGPLDGQSFEAELAWPPPVRLSGQDIHPSLVGTYELVDGWWETDPQEPVLPYELRLDEDYNRVERGWNRYRVMKAVADRVWKATRRVSPPWTSPSQGA